jgi:hypothetical protein
MERSITEGRQDRAAAMSGPSTGVARTFFFGGGVVVEEEEKKVRRLRETT